MTQEHPITPPPELVQQWDNDWHRAKIKHTTLSTYVATQAARWGADQELEACCEWFSKNYAIPSSQLRAARRPNPPSLKEQAFAELQLLKEDANTHGLSFDAPAIRRALEALPD